MAEAAGRFGRSEALEGEKNPSAMTPTASTPAPDPFLIVPLPRAIDSFPVIPELPKPPLPLLVLDCSALNSDRVRECVDDRNVPLLAFGNEELEELSLYTD